MNVDLNPEDEQLIQKRLRSGGFEDVQEVIHRALQAQDAEEAWLELHKKEVREKIDRAIAEFDQGGGIPASEVRLHTVRGKLVNPNLDLDRTSQLDALDDQARFTQK
jgi:antitoxin ParD1/3/4